MEDHDLRRRRGENVRDDEDGLTDEESLSVSVGLGVATSLGVAAGLEVAIDSDVTVGVSIAIDSDMAVGLTIISTVCAGVSSDMLEGMVWML